MSLMSHLMFQIECVKFVYSLVYLFSGTLYDEWLFKNVLFHFYSLLRSYQSRSMKLWMHRCQHRFKKIPSNLWVGRVGFNSFQEISYTCKFQWPIHWIRGSCLAQALGVTKFISRRYIILVTLCCAT